MRTREWISGDKQVKHRRYVTKGVRAGCGVHQAGLITRKEQQVINCIVHTMDSHQYHGSQRLWMSNNSSGGYICTARAQQSRQHHRFDHNEISKESEVQTKSGQALESSADVCTCSFVAELLIHATVQCVDAAPANQVAHQCRSIWREVLVE